jgi:hypothetical protein
VRPADVVKEAFLLERTSAAKYPLARATGGHPAEEADSAAAAPGALPWTGAATGLPLGTYDLVLITARGRVEGVSLGSPQAGRAGESSKEKAGEQRALSPAVSSSLSPLSQAPVPPKEPAGAWAGGAVLSEKDVESIRKLVLGMTSFADRRRVLFLEGSGTEARVLVEELTTRKTSLPSPVPFVVWRVEVWSYRKEFGAWDRYDSRVVARERLPVTEFEQTTWVFEPALGGLQVSEATVGAGIRVPATTVAYEVPQEFDPAHGLVAGKQKLPGDQGSR